MNLIKYQFTNTLHGEYAYLNTAKDILVSSTGMRKDRTNIGTLSNFAKQMRFDISESVPFLTTKQLAWKAVLRELLWFLRGSTDSKELEKEGVNIWKLNTTREFLDERGLKSYEVGDIGPMYGFVWRHAHAKYNGCAQDYEEMGFDQVSWLIQQLKEDPFSRRHMITTYIPEYKDQGVLFPCHGIVTQMYVEEDNDGKRHLSCHTYCRSQDVFLGQPFNIASYAIFTYIIAKYTGMHPKELIISTGDTHIYTNHVAQIESQLSRTPLPFPKLIVKDSVLEKRIGNLDQSDFELIGYLHHPAIKAVMAV